MKTATKRMMPILVVQLLITLSLTLVAYAAGRMHGAQAEREAAAQRAIEVFNGEILSPTDWVIQEVNYIIFNEDDMTNVFNSQ